MKSFFLKSVTSFFFFLTCNLGRFTAAFVLCVSDSLLCSTEAIITAESPIHAVRAGVCWRAGRRFVQHMPSFQLHVFVPTSHLYLFEIIVRLMDSRGQQLAAVGVESSAELEAEL